MMSSGVCPFRLIVRCASRLLTSESDTGDVFCITHRAEQALSDAADAFDAAKHFDFENMTEDCFDESENGARRASVAPSPTPTASQSATPRASVHDITNVCQAPQSAKLKAKAPVMKDPPSKGPSLGRAHTMPSLSQTASSSHSKTGRRPSKARSRGDGLYALQETEE